MNQSQFSFKFSYLKYRIVTFLSFITATRRMTNVLMSVLAIEVQTCGKLGLSSDHIHVPFGNFTHDLVIQTCEGLTVGVKIILVKKKSIMQVSFKNLWGHTDGLVKFKMPLFYREFSVLLCDLECFWGRLAHFSIFTRLFLLRQRAVHSLPM